jgi:hypothetical protein
MRNFIKLFEEYIGITGDESFLKRLQDKYSIEWINRVKENIFKNSQNQANIEDALGEWRYTGNYFTKYNETCQICSQHPIVYMFQIYNDLTNKDLLIGSDCIQKFAVIDTKAIKVYDDNQMRITNDRLIKKKIRKDLNTMIGDSKKIEALGILEELFEITNDPYIEKLYLDYTETNMLSPNRMLYVYMLMKRNKIEKDPKTFNIDLLHYGSIEELLNMDTNNFNIMWNLLTDGQRKKVKNRKEFWLSKMRKI